MRLTSAILLVSGLSSLTAAAPAPAPAPVAIAEPGPNVVVPGRKLKFSVKQKSKGKFRRTWPGVAMLNTYSKFNAAVPVAVKAAVTGYQKGTVVSTPLAWDEAYLSPVTVGNQTLNLNLDTGSADLWVYSTLLPTAATAGHDIYNVSSGTEMVGSTWNIVYGDGSGAGGKVYADKVVVGGVTATSQAVEAATSVSRAFLNDQHSDGLMGLAFSTLNTVMPNKQTTFFDTVKSSLAAPVFTASLKKGAAGSYDFGYIDPAKYKGIISYISVDSSRGFWQFKAGSYYVGNSWHLNSIGTAIADTGTTLMYLPTRTVRDYYARVAGSQYSTAYGGWIFPCASTLPTFRVIIGATAFAVPAANLNYGPLSATSCFGGLQENTGMSFSVFGDVFLKSVFAVFDGTTGRPRLGFAMPA